MNKAGKNFLKDIVEKFRSKLLKVIVGMLFACGSLFAFAPQVENFLTTYVLPRWHDSPILIKCMMIAIAGCLFSHIFDFIGGLLGRLFEYALEKLQDLLK